MKSHTEFQQFVVDIKLINLEISVVFFLLPNNEQCHQSCKNPVTWLTCTVNDSVNVQLSCYLGCFQAASLFPRTSPPGRDYVQWEHEALAAQDAVWQVPQCPCSDQPRGPHYFNLSVAHGIVTHQCQLSPTGKDVGLSAVNGLLCAQLSAIAQGRFKMNTIAWMCADLQHGGYFCFLYAPTFVYC